MIIERLVCGRTRTNAYVVAASADAPCLVVDPGAGALAQIARRATDLRLRPAGVVLTHGHFDHVWTARSVAGRYGVPAWMHPDDLGWLADPACGGHLPMVRFGGRLFGWAARLKPSELRPLSDGLRFSLAGLEISVLHTPGHTAGSVCLVVGDDCFTGDTVFSSRAGHTGYPGGSRTVLARSIEAKLLGFPDGMRLWPGHGPATTLGAVRSRLQAFVDATKREVAGWTS